MIIISEDYWQGSGWTSKAGKEIEGYWEGKGWKGTPALKEFGEELQDIKENHPAAYNGLMYNLREFKNNMLQSSGISSSINRLESAMTAGYRVGMANLSFLIGKAATTNPVISNFLNFINTLTFEIERTQQENWVGATLFGLLGAGLSTYLMGNPAIGYQIGSLTGGGLEAYYKTLNPIQAAKPGSDPFGLYNLFQWLGALGKLIDVWISGGPAALPWQGMHDREPPPLDPVDVNRQEVEAMKKYIRRYNLI